MNGLPRLLRLLELAAHDGDQRMLGDIFEQLDRNEGWSDAVDEFIDRLPAREASVIEEFRDIAGPSFLGQGGGASPQGGPIYAPRGSYPINAGAVRDAIGFGTWTAGWLLDETSGTLNAVFGAPNLTTNGGSPTYRNPGYLANDYAVAFTTVFDSWDGGATFDISATDDLIVAYVGRWSGVPSQLGASISKVSAGFGNGWAIGSQNAVNYGIEATNLGVSSSTVSWASGSFIGSWHAGFACVERGPGKIAFGSESLATLVQSLGGVNGISGTLTNASNFRVGLSDWVGAETNFSLAALYIGSGTNAALNASSNVSTALSNFVRCLQR